MVAVLRVVGREDHPSAGVSPEEDGDAIEVCRTYFPVPPGSGTTPRVAPESLQVGKDQPAVWFVGAHGGAGVTTLARVIGPAGDAGRWWPAADAPGLCVVVCRSTWTGLEAGHAAILQGVAEGCGGCEVLGLVVVADAPGRVPRVIERRIPVVGEKAAHVWRVPYVESWREGRMEDLPRWVPGMAVESRRGRRKSVGGVPREVAEFADDLVGVVRARLI